MVRHLRGCGGVVHGRRMKAQQMPKERHHQRLVVRNPMMHAITQPLGHDVRVLSKGVAGVAVHPAARVLQWLGQVPVIERGVGVDLGGQQFIDQPIIKVQTSLVDLAPPGGQNARPGDGKAVGFQP